MERLVISIARILFSKNIPFCIYRFPNEQKISIALDKTLLEANNRKTFWFAPFIANNSNEDIFFVVLNADEINESFLNFAQSLPQQKEIHSNLPNATTKAQYFHRIQLYLEEIHKGNLDKAVLSRVILEEKPQDFNPIDFFLKLANDYPDTFIHFSQHPTSGIWIGATPELLIKKQENKFYIMALAGTQARHKAGLKYNWHSKEIEEHQMVNQHIEQVLKKYACAVLDKKALQTVESAQVAHLKTDYIFEETKSIELASLLKDLHPTPSIGGLPVKNGIDCILQHEGYDRKYYCGFIGETNFSETTNLYINLRCLQVGKEHLAIYVGGGITAASNPEDEWKETILKSKTMSEKIQSNTIKLENGIVG